MSISETSICNDALLHLGVDTITSLSENSRQARLCNQIYANTRDQVLRGADWPCARRRSELATLSETHTGWSYVYAIPSDCLAVRHLYNAAQSTSSIEPAAPIDYEIALSTTGNKRVILSNEADATVVYTSAITDPPLFSDDLAEAIGYKVASKLALPLRQKLDVANRMHQMFELTLSKARAAAFNEEQNQQRNLDTILDSR